ncbi:MAG: 6-phosphogluconolactonase [Woeseia sp.]
MKWQASADAAGAAQAAAEFIARRLTLAIEARARATLAISGGRSPWKMFECLAGHGVEWSAVHVFQVDERIVPVDHAERNWKRFLESPLSRRIRDANRHPMPVAMVEKEDAELAIGDYSRTLNDFAGAPPVLDVVHLGIGADGHTASLFADDAPLHDTRHWVGVSRRHEGHRRLTLTLPVLNRAQSVVWFAVGASRRAVLARLHAGDPEIPASHVQRERAVCFTDLAAAPAI